MARIMLLADHKWRDLPNNVYLKSILENKYGHTVKLIRLGEDALLAKSFKPDLIAYNNLYERKKNAYARHMKECGISVVIVPTEGITFTDDQTLHFTHKAAGIEFIDAYCSWNSLMYDAIKENNVLSDEKLYMTGCSRFDFYQQPLSDLLKDRKYFNEKYGIPVDNRNVVFISNYANADFYGNDKFLKENMADQRADKVKVFSDLEKLVEYEYNYRNKAFEMLRNACSKCKDLNIIIKYHPSEKVSVYRDFVSELKQQGHNNVFLVEGEYIWDVLNISDVLVQRASTVAIEAWLLNKQTVELQLMPYEGHFLQPRYAGGSTVVHDIEELVSVIDDSTKTAISEEMQAKRKEILDYVAFKRDSKATERIAAVLDEKVCLASPDFSKLKWAGIVPYLKSVVRRVLGMKGYDVFKSVMRMKPGDFLGRYDKCFYPQDELLWSNRLSQVSSKGSSDA